MAGVCTIANCCPAVATRVTGGKFGCSAGNPGCDGESSRRTLGVESGLSMRSYWLGEQSRWHSAFGSRSRRAVANIKRMQARAGLDELLHNQVLVSSSVAGILGQLIKPLTSAMLGKGFNWKLIMTPGGLPSTHSAAVSAAATALGLERGLSDSFFGFSIIMASLVMYDAQGVRRSVGKQAEVINTMVFTQMGDYLPTGASSRMPSSPNLSPYAIGVELARDPVRAELAFMDEAEASTSQSTKGTAVMNKQGFAMLNGTPSRPSRLADESTLLNGPVARARMLADAVEELPSVKDGQVILEEIGNLDGWRHIPLKESVGHTKLEVFVGAMWGISVTLALHSIIQ